MLLCQTCLNEAPDGANHCPACGEPLAAPVAGARPKRTTLRPPFDPPLATFTPAPVIPAAPAGAWQPAAPAGGDTPAATVPSLSVQFPSGEVYELSGKRTFLVGRRDASSGMHPDLDLTAEGGVEAGVSRGHAAIHLRAEGYFIEDLGSANETLLNFQRLLPRQLYPLHSGDQVRFGLLNALVVIAE